MSRKTLIRGGSVLTLGAKTPNFVQGDVLIEDTTIAQVGQGLRARDAEVVDAADAIVMPGFVDTHRHTWKTLLRNAGAANADVAEVSQRYGRHYGPDDVYAATLLGLLSAAEVGITTVVDWCDILLSAEHARAALQAHADAGVRTVFAAAAASWVDAGDPPRGDSAPYPLTTQASGVRDPDPSDLGRVADEWSQARAQGLRIHAHVGAAPSDAGLAAQLADKGLLGADVTLVHCTHLDDADLDAIASHHAAVAIAPSSEMAQGIGRPPLQELIDHGIRPGLAIDDELVAPGDAFAQMRAAQSLQHATVFDRKLAGKGGVPNLLTTRDTIRYATVDGALVAGLGEVTGSLEPGKQADVIVLRTDRPNIFPVNDPIGAVVWGMDASNVDWVFVAGRAVVRAGVLDADISRARDLATAASQRVTAAAGDLFEATTGGSR